MFFVRSSDGSEAGPFPLEDIKRWIEDGTLSLFSPARREDQKRWRVLGAFTELARVRPGIAQPEIATTPIPAITTLPSPDDNPFTAQISQPPTPLPPKIPLPPPPAQTQVPTLQQRRPPPPPRSATPTHSTRTGIAHGKTYALDQEESSAEAFSLPKWLWGLWGITVGIWAIFQMANAESPIGDILLKFLLIPLLISYFCWKKTDQNRTVAILVFLAIFATLFLHSCG